MDENNVLFLGTGYRFCNVNVNYDLHLSIWRFRRTLEQLYGHTGHIVGMNSGQSLFGVF